MYKLFISTNVKYLHLKLKFDFSGYTWLQLLPLPKVWFGKNLKKVHFISYNRMYKNNIF